MTPPLGTLDEFTRVTLGAIAAAGRDVQIGHRLPLLFGAAGIGVPDGTDVAGRLEPLATASAMLDATHRSVLPVAVEHGLTTPERSEAWLSALAADAERRRRPPGPMAAADRPLEAQAEREAVQRGTHPVLARPGRRMTRRPRRSR